MAVVDTTNSFVNNEQITSAKLNNIMDNSFFVSGAVVPSQGLQITAGGQMQIGDGANGVTTAKLADLSVTPAKISTGGPSWTTSSISLPNPTTITGNATVTGETTSTGALTVGTAKMNVPTGTAPIFGVRAWVNFQGTVTANISGTAVRLSGSTTATITITNHGLLTGHRVYIDFGATIADSSYTITKVDNNTFTIVTGASTAATTTATVVLVVIRAGGNVSCVSRPSTGVFLINFTEAMPNAFYAGVCSTNNTSQPRFAALNRADSVNSYAKVETDDAQPSPLNFDENSVIIIG
jgi:hypothetical protein